MIRGTTPTHTFTLPIDTKLLTSIKITYAQDDRVIFSKNTEDCRLEGNTVKVTLTQEETFKFEADKHVQIQVRVLTNTGDLVSSSVMCVTVGKCLDGEVIA